MTDEEQINRLFEACHDKISAEGAAQVAHYLEHGEPEMALEGLVLELIQADETPPEFVFVVWENLARRMRLNEDPVFDGEFWRKFMDWGKKRSERS